MHQELLELAGCINNTENKMGADPYEYFVEYEQNISLALEKLRTEVFTKGEFNGSDLNPKTQKKHWS